VFITNTHRDRVDAADFQYLKSNNQIWTQSANSLKARWVVEANAGNKERCCCCWQSHSMTQPRTALCWRTVTANARSDHLLNNKKSLHAHS
jgi:hypothetical protein